MLAYLLAPIAAAAASFNINDFTNLGDIYSQIDNGQFTALPQQFSSHLNAVASFYQDSSVQRDLSAGLDFQSNPTSYSLWLASFESKYSKQLAEVAATVDSSATPAASPSSTATGSKKTEDSSSSSATTSGSKSESKSASKSESKSASKTESKSGSKSDSASASASASSSQSKGDAARQPLYLAGSVVPALALLLL